MQQRQLDDDDGIEVLDEDEYFVDDEDEPDLGPDERDADLMDGSWETRYYTQPARQRDWGTIQVAIGLLLAIAIVVPLLLAALP